MIPPQHEQIDDEMLSAFLDGELSTEQNRHIEQAINNDVELAARAERLTQVDDLVSQAHQQVLHEPVPQHLTDAVWQTKAKQPRAEVVNLARHQRFTGYIPMAAAASVALLIGGLLGQQLTDGSTDAHRLVQADAGVIITQNPLYIALEQTPSQQRFEAGNGDIILPVMSFQATDSRYCREFQINSDRKVSIGVACKQDGYWNTEILLAAGSRPMDNQNYQPASGYSQTALDAVLDDLWGGVAYGPAEEKVLIQQAWQ